MLEKREGMNNIESNKRMKHANVSSLPHTQHMNRRSKLKDFLLKEFPCYYESDQMFQKFN